MARATDDRSRNPSAYSHFLLGTDRDELYRLDDVILRRAVSRDDEATVAALARRRRSAGRSASRRRRRDRRRRDGGQVRAAADRQRLSGGPVRRGRAAVAAAGSARRGSFPARMRTCARSSRSPGSRRDASRPPTICTAGSRTRSATPSTTSIRPLRCSPTFRERGIVATEYLTAYVHALLEPRRSGCGAGRPSPTRC